jgi:O-antigen/teichoic acid export membrane protein
LQSIAAQPGDPPPENLILQEITEPPPSKVQPLGAHTARGFVWMFAQTVLTKGLGFISQIVTAWFLVPHDTKLIGLTFAAASFPALIRDAGLQAILVQRQKQLRRWIGPVFWLSMVLGFVAAIVMAAMAPVVAQVFKEPRLVGLLDVVAAGSVLGALGTVPSALVQIKLRFRFQAVLAMLSSGLIQSLSMILAWRGFGPYSFIVPNAVWNGVSTALLWWAAPNRISWRVKLRRWPLLFPDSSAILLIAVLWAIVNQGDNLLLSWFHRNDPPSAGDTTGIFWFAFNLSWQTLVLLTLNLGSVLFPSLTKLQYERPRQMQAFLRGARLLAMIAVPLCFLQAVAAAPAFHLVFKPKWYPAIPVMQALCLGMAIRAVGLIAPGLNMSQGRFKLQLIITAIGCTIFVTSVAIAARFGGALAVGRTEAVVFALTDPITLWVLLKINGVRPAPAMARVFLPPIFAGALATGVAWGVGQMVPHPVTSIVISKLFNAAQLGVLCLVTAAIYMPLIRKLSPGDWDTLWSLLRRKRKAAEVPAGA